MLDLEERVRVVAVISLQWEGRGDVALLVKVTKVVDYVTKLFLLRIIIQSCIVIVSLLGRIICTCTRGTYVCVSV